MKLIDPNERIGFNFGRLIIRSVGPRDKWNRLQYWCECCCGQGRLVEWTNLHKGRQVSCGCYLREVLKKGRATHGLSKSPEYRTVYSHHRNKFYPSAPDHQYYKDLPFESEWSPRYGGSYAAGAQWIQSHLGAKPSPQHTLDIIDHEKGFVKGNLRWITQEEQNQNQRLLNISDATFQREVARRGFYLVPICSNPATIGCMVPFVDEQICAICRKPVDTTVDTDDAGYFLCSQCGHDQAIPEE
jgi:hypothetical protein